ncbi:response regulator [Patescibacteria group bacterium]|nr:response regulator [Patescibacteria group bacterium]
MGDKPIKVLLIEDNPAYTRLIREMIAEARNIPKLDLEHTDCLSTGLKRLTKGGIDMVLLDLRLPDSQGLDTLIKLHDQVSQMPIVVLTGLADEALGVKAVQKGAQDYLVKGQVDSNLLVRAMRYATERKKAEEALVQERDLLQALIDNIPDSIYFKDDKNRFVRVNKAKAEHPGATPENMIGKTDFDYFPKEQAKEAFTDDNQVMESNRPLVDKVEKTTHADGTEHWASITKIPRHNERGQVIGTMGISRDITERKKAEETLIRSEKLRALGEMAAGVAHDFNNLLAIILGNAQLLERGMERYKAEEIRQRLNIIARTAEEGGETVKRLQYFTRAEVSRRDFAKTDLNKIVKAAIASTSPRWKDETEAKGITIRIKEKLGKLPPLLGSRSELMEVLTNLIFNSLEAMPEGGEITIRTKATKNKIYLYFTDTGKGIPGRIKDRIFDPFFSTKGPKASGLGLSVSYGIIKRHQGKIKVEGTEGEGTTFTISIPIGLQTPLKKEKLKEPEKISFRKILVIDNEEGIRDVLGRIFQDRGHRVTLAETSRKGLAKFKQANFDLVLTNLGMPEMSGWELAKKIKEIDPDVPVGLITGWGVTLTKEKMKEEGVDFILSKPFDYTKVVREVNSILKSGGDSHCLPKSSRDFFGDGDAVRTLRDEGYRLLRMETHNRP